jgi:hypothetical protein
MHDASSEHVVREKHGGTPRAMALFERYDNGRNTIGSLDTEVIIFLRKDTKLGVARIVKSAGEYSLDT